MAKRRKQKNKKIKHSEPEQIGGVDIVEEIIEKPEESFEHKQSHAKTIEKISTEKVKPAPQTYVEDTFDLNNQISNEVKIENEIKPKQKKFITREELFNNTIFKNKLYKAKTRVEFNKGFDFLLDFSNSSKAYKTFELDEKYDDFDIILEEVSQYFIIKLAKTKLKYSDLQLFQWYFKRLKTLYNDYKHSDLAQREKLNSDLEKMKAMSNLIRWHLF
jgi:hypothetical protein